MTQNSTNIVSEEINRIAEEFGYKPSSIASLAFKNSRKAEQLKRRDDNDRAALEKLGTLRARLEQERLEKVKRMFPRVGAAIACQVDTGKGAADG